MKIVNYDDKKHRSAVIEIWKTIFNYQDARNAPELSIDQKVKQNDRLFFVAEMSDHAIGTIMAGYDGHRGWIYSLAVLPEYRKKSIGTQLLQYAENELKKRGCIKINLQIVKSNETVKNFYLKNNYKIEERISMGKEISENVPEKK